MKKIISPASLQGISSIINYLKQNNAQFVFWIRSANFERNLFVSPTYEAIWKRSCKSVYEKPWSFFDAMDKEDLALNRDEISERTKKNNLILFRIHTPDQKIRWIKDYSFALHDVEGRIIAIAGFSECISEEEWKVLANDPIEKKIEAKMMDMLLEFTKMNCELKAITHPYANLLGAARNVVLFLADLSIHLSTREEECLRYMMKDMTAKEIARLIKLSPRTVESYLSKIKDKVNVRTNLSLASKVLALVNKHQYACG